MKIVQPIEIPRHSVIQFVLEKSENKIVLIFNHKHLILLSAKMPLQHFKFVYFHKINEELYCIPFSSIYFHDLVSKYLG